MKMATAFSSTCDKNLQISNKMDGKKYGSGEFFTDSS